MPRSQILVAILPCNNLDASEVFYARLGFTHREGNADYRMLSNGLGGELHLAKVVEGWLMPGRNSFGLYLYIENVDELAAALGCTAEDKPWGTCEFALSDPDETLVRVGWPRGLRESGHDRSRHAT